MAYSDIALLAVDWDFLNRCAACVATEPGLEAVAPIPWASEHAWNLAGTPGFGEAYASALANNVERPGNDPSVISDAQILSAVQNLAATQ